MSDAIAGIISNQSVKQPLQAPPAVTEVKTDSAQPKTDAVAISSHGKQAIALGTAGSTPQEETKENPVEKIIEAMAGKK